jgi:hypothetical protein
MSFIPPNEKIIEKKTCRISGQEFFVTDKDLEFYDKISPVFAGQKYLIPSPTLCPEERQRRRFAFRNERKLYHRKCDRTGNQIISIYSPDKPYTVYDHRVWWWDDWSAFDYGVKFDFNRKFFEQFDSLMQHVPLLSIYNLDSENSDYTNFAGYNKNCYLTFWCFNSENCLYGKWISKCRNCIDGFFINDTEKCYEVINCQRCYDLKYWKNCADCRESWFLRNCRNCDHCFGCDNQVGKSYLIFNKPVEKEKYDIEVQNYLRKYKPENIHNIFQSRSILEKNFTNSGSDECIGDLLNNCSNCYMTYNSTNSVDCKFNDWIKFWKSSYDTIWNNIDSSFLCECLGVGNSSNIFSAIGSEHCSLSLYTLYSQNISDSFGCIGLKKWTNCIFNTSYSKHEYQELAWRIAEHMRETWEWWEFFPIEMSPFGYDETVAQEYFPLTQLEAEKQGWKWKDEEETSSYHGEYYQTRDISEYNEKIVGNSVAQKNIDEVLWGILKCEMTGKPFKIIKQELIFYIENQIPLPSKHPDQRHRERFLQCNQRKLFERECAECRKKIITTFQSDSPEKVVCEDCYRKLVY